MVEIEGRTIKVHFLENISILHFDFFFTVVPIHNLVNIGSDNDYFMWRNLG